MNDDDIIWDEAPASDDVTWDDAPKPEPSAREQWLETLKSWGRTIGDAVGPAPVRGTANALLAVPSFVASGVGAGATALGFGDEVDQSMVAADKLPYTVDKMIPDRLAPALKRVLQGPPDNMTPAQNVVNRAGEFATMGALTPGGTGTKILKEMATAAGYGGTSGGAVGVAEESGLGPVGQATAGILAPLFGHGGLRLMDYGKTKFGDASAMLDHRTPEGLDKLTYQGINKRLAGTPDHIRTKLIGTLDNAQDGDTVAQTIAKSQMDPEDPLLNRGLLQLERETADTGIGTRLKEQQKDALDRLTAQAGGRTYVERNAVVEAQKGVRDAGYGVLQRPVIERVNETANQANALNKQIGILGDQSAALAAELPGLKRTEINALQGQGQMQTTARNEVNSIEPRGRGADERWVGQRNPVAVSQPGLLNPQTFTLEPPTVAMGGGRAPEGLPPTRVKSGERDVTGSFPEQRTDNPYALNQNQGEIAQRLRNADSADAAAREFAEARADAIAKQKDNIDEISVLDSEIAQLSAAASDLKPLKVDDLTSRLKSLRETAVNVSDPDVEKVIKGIEKQIVKGRRPDGTIDAVTLMDIRGRASQSIGKLMKKNPKMSDAKAIAAIDTAKGTIDRAITDAGGGPAWGMALKTYGRLSDAVTGKRIQNGLLEAYTPRKGEFSPDRFLDVTGGGEAERTFLKSAGVANPEKKTIADYLSKEDFAEISAIRRQLEANRHIDDVISSGGRSTPNIEKLTETAQAPFALKFPVVGAFNWAMRDTADAAQSAFRQNLDTVMKNPKQVAAGLLKYQPKAPRQMPESAVTTPLLLNQAAGLGPEVQNQLFEYLNQLMQQMGTSQ